VLTIPFLCGIRICGGLERASGNARAWNTCSKQEEVFDNRDSQNIFQKICCVSEHPYKFTTLDVGYFLPANLPV